MLDDGWFARHNNPGHDYDVSHNNNNALLIMIVMFVSSPVCLFKCVLKSPQTAANKWRTDCFKIATNKVAANKCWTDGLPSTTIHCNPDHDCDVFYTAKETMLRNGTKILTNVKSKISQKWCPAIHRMV